MNQSWRAYDFGDTPPNVERRWHALLRQAPSWRKLRMASQLYLTARRLMMVGLRDRYPNMTEDDLRRRLADLLLGPELAEKTYGPMPGPRGA